MLRKLLSSTLVPMANCNQKWKAFQFVNKGHLCSQIRFGFNSGNAQKIKNILQSMKVDVNGK